LQEVEFLPTRRHQSGHPDYSLSILDRPFPGMKERQISGNPAN
jgi:hypothetical protein